MTRFKELTTGENNNFVLMGRKTFESLPSKLKNRTNIIVSRDQKFKQPVGTFVYQSIVDVITEYVHYNYDNRELWVIGGSEVYNQSIQYADKIYLTVIDYEFGNVDAYFTKIKYDEWEEIEVSESYIDEVSQLSYKFITYQRIK